MTQNCCLICGNTLGNRSSRALYCSPKCKSIANARARYARNSSAISAKNNARQKEQRWLLDELVKQVDEMTDFGANDPAE